MLGGRALLAFRALEKDGDSYSEDAELGADLTLETQNAIINIDRMLTAYFEALASTKPRTDG